MSSDETVGTPVATHWTDEHVEKAFDDLWHGHQPERAKVFSVSAGGNYSLYFSREYIRELLDDPDQPYDAICVPVSEVLANHQTKTLFTISVDYGRQYHDTVGMRFCELRDDLIREATGRINSIVKDAEDALRGYLQKEGMPT